MQAKDIDDIAILKYLDALPQHQFALLYKDAEYSVFAAMPDGVEFNLARAKMGKMIKRGLVNGCSCGCRGDFTITDKGRALL